MISLHLQKNILTHQAIELVRGYREQRENTPFNHHYTHTHTHTSLLLDFSKFLFILLSPEYFFSFHFTIPGAINQIHQPLCVRRALTTDCMSEREREGCGLFTYTQYILFLYMYEAKCKCQLWTKQQQRAQWGEKVFFSSMNSCLCFFSL